MPIFNAVKKKFLDGDIDLLTDTIKVMLLDSTLEPNIDNDVTIDDVDTNEISGTGYTAGGATLASKTNVVDNTNDLSKFDAADVEWTTATFTARYAVVYKDTGVAGTSPMIGYIDFLSNKSVSGSTFKIEWNTDGILTQS